MANRGNAVPLQSRDRGRPRATLGRAPKYGADFLPGIVPTNARAHAARSGRSHPESLASEDSTRSILFRSKPFPHRFLDAGSILRESPPQSCLLRPPEEDLRLEFQKRRRARIFVSIL